ncbi:MAG: AbrB/MazE/SpoVT family DNA-binding domain-containing protein [Acutalibacteraceae bacterium]
MGKKRGLIRRVDQLGRIVLPMEARKMLHIQEKDGLEILVDTEKGQIILQKVEDSCFLCRSTEDLKEVKDGLFLCRNCIRHLSQE